MCSHFFFQSKKSIFGFNIVERKYNLGDLEEYGKSTFPYMMGMKQPEASYTSATHPLVCVKVLVATEG